MNKFDFINAICDTKKNLIDNEITEDLYIPGFTNLALTYHPDTILYANEMNCNYHLDKKLQFDYLINSIRKAKRKQSKWAKKIKDENIAIVKEYFGYSYEKAKAALSVLTEDQLVIIRKRLEKGGL